jgi:dsDNA-specific endonuclease/ATPase MutS2
MGQDPSAKSTTVTESNDPGQIREGIDATRQELGDTVAALSEKADIKAQAKQKLEDTKASVAGKKDQLLGKAREASPQAAVSAASQASQRARQHPVPLAVAGAFATGFLAGRVSGR